MVKSLCSRDPLFFLSFFFFFLYLFGFKGGNPGESSWGHSAHVVHEQPCLVPSLFLSFYQLSFGVMMT